MNPYGPKMSEEWEEKKSMNKTIKTQLLHDVGDDFATFPCLHQDLWSHKSRRDFRKPGRHPASRKLQSWVAVQTNMLILLIYDYHLVMTNIAMENHHAINR